MKKFSRIVRESQRFADEILRKDIDALHRLAKELLKYETIDAKDLEKITNGETLTRALNGTKTSGKPKRPRRKYSKKPASKSTTAKTSNNEKTVSPRNQKKVKDSKASEVKT